MKEIFLLCAALAGAPAPAPEYRAPISEETAAALFETCTTCRGGAPIYPKPSSHARTIYDPEEEDAAEARARTINFDYD